MHSSGVLQQPHNYIETARTELDTGDEEIMMKFEGDAGRGVEDRREANGRSLKKGTEGREKEGKMRMGHAPTYIEERKEEGRGEGHAPFLRMATLLPEEDAQNEM